MPRLLLACAALLAAAPLLPSLSAAEKAVPYAQVLGPIRLWAGAAPGATGERPQDIPTLTPYAPAGRPSGAGARTAGAGSPGAGSGAAGRSIPGSACCS